MLSLKGIDNFFKMVSSGAWSEHFDKKKQKYYYYNKETKKTQWQKPAEFAGSSSSLAVPVTQPDTEKEAAIDKFLKTTTWRRAKRGDGKVYYFEKGSNKTQWTAPEVLNDFLASYATTTAVTSSDTSSGKRKIDAVSSSTGTKDTHKAPKTTMMKMKKRIQEDSDEEIVVVNNDKEEEEGDADFGEEDNFADFKNDEFPYGQEQDPFQSQSQSQTSQSKSKSQGTPVIDQGTPVALADQGTPVMDQGTPGTPAMNYDDDAFEAARDATAKADETTVESDAAGSGSAVKSGLLAVKTEKSEKEKEKDRLEAARIEEESIKKKKLQLLLSREDGIFDSQAKNTAQQLFEASSDPVIGSKDIVDRLADGYKGYVR